MKQFIRVRSLMELQREKQKDYRNIVLIQISIIVVGLIFSEPLLEDSKSTFSKFIILTFSTFGAVYAFLLWDLLRNFTANVKLIGLILIILLGITVLGILGEFPFYQIIEFPDRQAYLLLIHGLLFPIELTVIGFAIRDIFSGGHLSPDKLWGAACVYLMTGISFGSLFDLICIAKPGSLGESIELGLPNYAECVTYSLSVMGGIDPNYPNASKLIQHISVLEAVWANLFAMLIIGKLLGLPRAPNPTGS